MSGRYQPEVSAFFPKLGRGHSGKNCLACKTGQQKTHSDQAGNRKDWEASVGIRRTEGRTTKGAHRQMRPITDPKGLAG